MMRKDFFLMRKNMTGKDYAILEGECLEGDRLVGKIVHQFQADSEDIAEATLSIWKRSPREFVH